MTFGVNTDRSAEGEGARLMFIKAVLGVYLEALSS